MANKSALIIVLLICTSLFVNSCEDSQTPGGCPTYTHIVDDVLFLHVDYDSVTLYFAADEHYSAPISCVTEIHEELIDSLIVIIHGYGQSSKPEPDPYLDYVWDSDTLAIWYSGNPTGLEPIMDKIRPIDGSTPCIPANYKIDYIIIRHSDDLVVDVDCTVRTIY